MADKINVICNVCGGKGGWKVDKKTPYDSGWNDCLYCEGYGFHSKEQEDDKEGSLLLRYTFYKKQIIEALVDTVAGVETFNTTDYGKTIEIRISPYNKGVFGDFVKFALKISQFSTKLSIRIVQDYIYKKEQDKYFYQWKIILQPENLDDLDGFVDLIRLWDKRGGM